MPWERTLLIKDGLSSFQSEEKTPREAPLVNILPQNRHLVIKPHFCGGNLDTSILRSKLLVASSYHQGHSLVPSLIRAATKDKAGFREEITEISIPIQFSRPLTINQPNLPETSLYTQVSI